MRRMEVHREGQDFGTSRWGGSSLEPISVGRRCERGLYVAFWHICMDRPCVASRI